MTRQNSQLNEPANRSRTSALTCPVIHVTDTHSLLSVVKGERKAGGLIITPLPSTSNTAFGSFSTLTNVPPLPPSSQGSSHRSKHGLDVTMLDGSDISSSVAALKKGKGKSREVVAPTRQDLEVEEDVRRMDAERERLRIREAQAQSTLSSDFKAPLLLPPSVQRRRQTGLAYQDAPSTPVNGSTIDIIQPIPLRDTPIIDRNRAMRGEPVERRRSSLSRRGKRASSSFEHTGIIRKDIYIY